MKRPRCAQGDWIEAYHHSSDDQCPSGNTAGLGSSRTVVTAKHFRGRGSSRSCRSLAMYAFIQSMCRGWLVVLTYIFRQQARVILPLVSHLTALLHRTRCRTPYFSCRHERRARFSAMYCLFPLLEIKRKRGGHFGHSVLLQVLSRLVLCVRIVCHRRRRAI